MTEIEKTEKAKYSEIWQSMDYSSKGDRSELLNAIRPHVKGKILEIGCGNGDLVAVMRDNGINVIGLDITLDGLIRPEMDCYVEAPVWDLPFANNEFDLVYSCDVLEHIPKHMLLKTINELHRVAKNNAHMIATFPDHKYCGHDVHLSVAKIDFWKKMFNEKTDTVIERSI